MTKYEHAAVLRDKGKTLTEIGRVIGSSRSSVAGLLWYAKHRAPTDAAPLPGSSAWWKARGY